MDKIEICNMALSRIGLSPIEALTEVSEEARRCDQFYEHDRRVVLRRFPWPWATRRVDLPQIAVDDVMPRDYVYAYRYPADCACLRKIYVADGKYLRPLPDFISYRIVSDATGRLIYTNEPRVVAEYTADVKDATLMDEIFCEALSWKLASSIAFKLTGSEQLAQMAIGEYERIFLTAAADAENEQNVKTPELNTFVRARWE